MSNHTEDVSFGESKGKLMTRIKKIKCLFTINSRKSRVK